MGVATSTVEQYVKTIYHLQKPEQLVQTQAIADSLKVTPGTATVMIKHLAEERLVNYTPRYGVTLTAAGTTMALRLLRYHRLIETFLVEVLGYDWSEIHQEAEVLEHAVSDVFIQKVDRLLGYPTHDPHGDPIPNAQGRVTESLSQALSDCPVHTKAIISRFEDTSPNTLGLMADEGLGLGTSIRVTASSPAAGVLTLEGPKGSITLSLQLAQTIRVVL